MMRVLVIENYVETPLGLVGQALAEVGADIDLRQAWRGAALPGDHADHDGLVILGGAQNALADDTHPYLPAVAALARSYGEADKAVLGICLGAQLLARAYGGQNILGRPVEFGWHPVRPTDDGRSDPLIAALGDGSSLFHWHFDTFTPPPCGTHLATSARTDQQAFRIGRAVYGIQFHFEADRAIVERWSEDFAEAIAGIDPGWLDRRPTEAVRYGQQADAVGLALARAWVSLI